MTDKPQLFTALAGEPNMPFNEVNIKFKDTKKGINYRYGLTVKLTQDDLPYDPRTKTSEKVHFVVCADTVIIDSALINPGKDISIFARKIICKPGAKIITTNVAPAADWASGTYPEQKDLGPGAEGAKGANGGDGGNAGNIRIRAESIVTETAGVSGEVKIQLWEPRDILKEKVTARLAIFRTQPVSIPDTRLSKVPFISQDLVVPFDVDIKNIRLTALENLTTKVTWDPYTDISNVECSGSVSLAYTMTINMNGRGFSGEASGSYSQLISQAYKMDVAKYEFAKEGTQKTESMSPLFMVNWLVDDMTKLFLAVYTGVILDAVCQKLFIYLESKLKEPFESLFENGSLGTKADLILMAKGGRGGQGQDGHIGVQGALGNAGQVRAIMDPFKANGGPGQRGGRGGDAGKAGTGGNGGSISVSVIKGSALLNYSVAGGDTGPRGMGANGGPGGKGGVAGSWMQNTAKPGGMPSFKEVAGIEGSVGPTGNPAAFMGALGAFGTNGTFNKEAGNYKTIAQSLFAEQLLITQRAAEFSFLAAVNATDYEYPVMLASWLNNISSAVLGSDFTAEQWTDETKPIAQSIRGFSDTMLGNFQRGLDFYGHYRSWTPILSLNSYQKRIDQLITLGKIIEDQYRVYQNESTKAEEKMATINMVKTKLEADLTQETEEIKDMLDEISRLDKLVAELGNALQEHNKVIIKAEDLFTIEFKAYTKRKTECDFEQVIELIVTIVTAGAAVLEKINGIKGAFDKFSGAKETMDKMKGGIKVLEEAKATIDALKKGNDKIQKLINPAKKEIGLMITQKEEFDKMIKEYLGEFDAAQKLKDAVDQLFNLIETRNEAICTYTSHYITTAKRQAEVDQKKAQIGQVITLMKQAQADPALPAYTAFMQNAYTSLKTVIVRKLYEENRAFEYWSLQESNFSTHDVNMATLSNTHAQLLLKIDTFKERKGLPFQPFTQQLDINTADWEIPFRAFASTKKFVFNFGINRTEFKNKYQVMVSKVKIELPDIQRKEGVIYMRLKHSGVCYQVADAGKPAIQFSHMPRTVPYQIDYKNPVNTGGGVIGDNETQGGKQGYAGLSPFTSWTLDFSLLSDEEFKGLESVKIFRLTFEGTFIQPQWKKLPEEAVVV